MSFSLVNSSSLVESQFGLKVLAELTAPGAALPQPCVFSPISILLSLALVHLGAKGHTRNEIRNAIVNGSTDEQFIEHFRFLSRLVNSSVNDVETHIANRLFVAPEQAIRKAFTDELREHYNAGTAQVDFKNAQNASEAINTYISESTRGKITDMIKPDNLKDVDAMLVNAVFFQGDWRTRFGTPTESNFSTTPTENRLVPMLRELRDYHYNKDEHFELIGIPFKDKSAWFAILLPVTRHGLRDALASLNAARFHNLVGGAHMRPVFFTFPKFKLDYKISLNAVLSKFGLSELFTERADLSGIGPGLQLASATHQALIEVDQVGTRAAAVTEAKVFFVSADSSLQEPLTIRADHPFLFAIIKDAAPLFMGVYA